MEESNIFKITGGKLHAEAESDYLYIKLIYYRFTYTSEAAAVLLTFCFHYAACLLPC